MDEKQLRYRSFKVLWVWNNPNPTVDDIVIKAVVFITAEDKAIDNEGNSWNYFKPVKPTLQEQYKSETGDELPVVDHNGNYDLGYVEWLEEKVREE